MYKNKFCRYWKSKRNDIGSVDMPWFLSIWRKIVFDCTHIHFTLQIYPFCLMRSVTIAIQEDTYIALSAEWSLSILRYIFFLFISKTTLKRRQNILNDELNIHITYISDDFLWNSNSLYFSNNIWIYIYLLRMIDKHLFCFYSDWIYSSRLE